VFADWQLFIRGRALAIGAVDVWSNLPPLPVPNPIRRWGVVGQIGHETLSSHLLKLKMNLGGIGGIRKGQPANGGVPREGVACSISQTKPSRPGRSGL